MKFIVKSGLHQGNTYNFSVKTVRVGQSQDCDLLLLDSFLEDVWFSVVELSDGFFEIEVIRGPLFCEFDGQVYEVTDVIRCPKECRVSDGNGLQIDLVGEVVSASDSTSNPAASEIGVMQFNTASVGVNQLPNLRPKFLPARQWVFFVLLISLPVTLFALGTNPKRAAEVQPHSDTMVGLVGSSTPIRTPMPNRMLEPNYPGLVRQELEPDVLAGPGSSIQFKSETPVDLTIVASLTREEVGRFEKKLQQVTADLGDKVQIKAQVKLTEEQQRVDQLQLKKLVLGQMASATLSDGTVLHTGSRYHNFEVVSINQQGVTLKGNAQYRLVI